MVYVVNESVDKGLLQMTGRREISCYVDIADAWIILILCKISPHFGLLLWIVFFLFSQSYGTAHISCGLIYVPVSHLHISSMLKLTCSFIDISNICTGFKPWFIRLYAWYIFVSVLTNLWSTVTVSRPQVSSSAHSILFMNHKQVVIIWQAGLFLQQILMVLIVFSHILICWLL